MYSSGVESCAGMPRFMKRLPRTLLRITTVAQIHVLTRRRAASVGMRSVAGAYRRGRRFGGLLLRHEFPAFGAQRHVLFRFLGKTAALFVVEDRLLHDAPDHARAEEVFTVEALDPIDQLAAIEARVDDVGK